MRYAKLQALCVVALCSLTLAMAARAAPSGAIVTEAGPDRAVPFPKITASSLRDLKEAACGWARRHFRAPQRATADTVVLYMEVIGDSNFATENAPPGLGFRDVYVFWKGGPVHKHGVPRQWRDFIADFGTYHVTLIDRRDANADLTHYCPTRVRQHQVSYLDPSLMGPMGGAQQVCVRVVPGMPKSHFEKLERFEHISTGTGRYEALWSGDRWSGAGGGFIAVPTFRMPPEDYHGEADLNCSGVSTEGLTDIREFDRRAWRLDLAPSP